MQLFLEIVAAVPGGASETGITAKDKGTILAESRSQWWIDPRGIRCGQEKHAEISKWRIGDEYCNDDPR